MSIEFVQAAGKGGLKTKKPERTGRSGWVEGLEWKRGGGGYFLERLLKTAVNHRGAFWAPALQDRYFSSGAESLI